MNPSYPRGFGLLCFLIFSYLFINTAWVAEDAFITFRSVDQLLAGNGPVWNLGERVQVYTHPLWYALLSLGTALGMESYWLALLLSYGLLLMVLGLLFQLARQLATPPLLLGAALLLLSLSRAFIDFSSSGLENPLQHVLLLAYLLVYLSARPRAQRFFWTTFIYGLLFLTRPDAIIMVTPASAYLWFQLLKSRQPWLKPALWALLPVIGWEIFSLLYYGSPVPNTALAKVNIDYPPALLHDYARNFFLVNFQLDPLTLGTIAIAGGLGLLGGWRRCQRLPALLALGLLLQLAYLFRIGGDYMLGRFLSAPLLLAVAVLLLSAPASLKLNLGRRAPYGLLLLPLLLLSVNYRPGLNYHNREIIKDISDERGFFYPHIGLLPVLVKQQGQYYTNSLFYQGNSFTSQYMISCFIGMQSWAMAPDRQVIDPLGLTEPFLARLPARLNARIGHYERAFPPGFVQSRVSSRPEENLLVAPELAALYDDVRRVTRSPALLSSERLAAIWRLNTGHYRNMGRYFDREDVNLREVNISDADLRAINDPDSRVDRSLCFAKIEIF